MKNSDLLIWGALGAGVLYLIWKIPRIPSHQEGALWAFSNSSLGQLAERGAGLYNDWGVQEPFTDAEAAEIQRISDAINRETGITPGGLKTL